MALGRRLSHHARYNYKNMLHCMEYIIARYNRTMDLYKNTRSFMLACKEQDLGKQNPLNSWGKPLDRCYQQGKVNYTHVPWKGEHCDFTLCTKKLFQHPKSCFKIFTMGYHKPQFSSLLPKKKGKGGEMVSQWTHQLLPWQVWISKGEISHSATFLA